MTKDVSEAKKFLTWLHGKAIGQRISPDATLKVLIWCAPAKRSFFYSTITSAAQKAIKLSEEKQNVYVGMGLLGSPPNKGRGKLEDIDAISGVWADIDFGKQTEKGKTYPPNEKSARLILKECGLPPSIVIHSGHGLQTYWLFDKPMIFFDDDDRTRAAALARGWIDTLKAHASKHDWVLDPVGDLTRVLRIPGTKNYKDKPVKVRLA